jgi:hypothetical protein
MKLQEEVASMRRMSEMLSCFSYPVKELQDEIDIYPLKTRTLIVDGYEVIAHLNIAEYGRFKIEILQLESARSIYLPMHLLVKIGKMFLGSEEVCYIEFYRNNRKVYCWTVRRKGDTCLPPLGETLHREFDGFSFYVAKPESN